MARVRRLYHRALALLMVATGLLAGVLAVSPAAASASTSTVPLSAQLVVLNHTGVTNPGGQPDCSTAQFLEVSAGSGITSYQGFVDSTAFGQNVTVSLSGPPFPDDHFDPGSHGLGNLGEAPWSFDAPAGTHWWALDWFNSVGACRDPASVGYVYFNPRAQGLQAGHQLSGKVTDLGGQGVSGVTLSAASTGAGGTYSTSTASDGTYSVVVPADTYTVTPSRGQDSFKPSASTADLTVGDATANFTLESSSAISVADVTLHEPTAGTVSAAFVVTLDHSSSATVKVDYGTQDGTATAAHGDYTPVTGTLTFAPGTTSQTVSVSVNATGLAGDHAFSLVLSNPSQNATIARANATGTITGLLRLDAVKPASGSPTAGKTLSLTGRGFGRRGDHDAVNFAVHCSDGSTAQASAGQVTVLSGQRIRATVPADPCPKGLAKEPADVTVQIFDASGSPTDSNARTYTYLPEYVALGDSYSSGEGTGVYSLGAGCKRSPDAFGPLISASRGFKFDFRACSGARSTGVLGQTAALKSSTSLVTLSVGGNDAGFGSVLTTCSTRSVKACEAAIGKADSLIASQLPASLAGTYVGVASRATNALVVVLAYPHLFTTDGQTCGLNQLTSSEEKQLNQTVDQLDALITSAAAAHGFTLVDPRAAFSSHEVCSTAPWLNGLSFPTSESYHPNIAGQAQFATLIGSSLP